MSRAEEKAKRRARVLSVSRELVSARGAANATVSDIAAGAGTSIGGVYLLFEDKDAILRALLAEDLASGVPWEKAVLAYIPSALHPAPPAAFDLSDVE